VLRPPSTFWPRRPSLRPAVGRCRCCLCSSSWASC
jgi:hypothetical protein